MTSEIDFVVNGCPVLRVASLESLPTRTTQALSTPLPPLFCISCVGQEIQPISFQVGQISRQAFPGRCGRLNGGYIHWLPRPGPELELIPINISSLNPTPEPAPALSLTQF